MAARELFFTAKASRVNVDKLTNQCFQQFLSIKQTKGSKYAIALFYNLLSKSKDNPNAYVVRAVQQGATASLEDEQNSVWIVEAGDDIFKEIGVDILQKDLEAALSKLYLNGQSQALVKDELDSFTARISR
jgi:hypothetical protein